MRITVYLVNLLMISLMLTTLSSCEDLKNREPKTIIFVGDLLLDRGVRERIEHFGIDHLFRPELDSLFKSADVVIANLECPATLIEAPINKQFIFRAEPKWLKSLKNHGLTHLNLANNHAMDQGRGGLVDTEGNVVNSGLKPLGFGHTLKEACEPNLIMNSPQKVYVLSSLHVPSENWTYLENQPCVCEQSFDNLADQIKSLKSIDSKSLVIIQLHWGMEHVTKPLAYQKQQAHLLINAGADCIVGHHPHTLQTIEYYKGKPIYFSIGNFIFDQSKSINSKGVMVKISVLQDSLIFDTIPYTIDKCVPILD